MPYFFHKTYFHLCLYFVHFLIAAEVPRTTAIWHILIVVASVTTLVQTEQFIDQEPRRFIYVKSATIVNVIF